MASFLATAISILDVLIWQATPTAINSINIPLMIGILGVGGLSNLVLLAAAIEFGQKADSLSKRLEWFINKKK